MAGATAPGQNEGRHVFGTQRSCFRRGQVECPDNTVAPGCLEIVVTAAGKPTQQTLFDIAQIKNPFADVFIFKIGKLACDFAAGLMDGRAGVNPALANDVLCAIDEKLILENQQLAFQDSDIATVEITAEALNQIGYFSPSLIQDVLKPLDLTRNLFGCQIPGFDTELVPHHLVQAGHGLSG